MFIIPTFYQSEFQSFIFLIFNLLIILFLICFIEPFSLLYLLIYFSIVIFICRKLAHRQSYTIPKNTDLTEQTVIVTGASSGIGRVSAIEFAKLGAKVIVGIRGENRARQIAEELKNDSHREVIGEDLDLSNLSNVKKFADRILNTEQHVEILLNNAGISQTTYALTIDGLEMDFGTNHIGHFYLTKLLLSLLIQSKSRIVNVSSIGHCSVENGINHQFPSLTYDTKIAYGQSKLAQIWHTIILQERYGEEGINAYSVHPGVVYTKLTRQQPFLFEFIYRMILLLVGKSLYEGAKTRGVRGR